MSWKIAAMAEPHGMTIRPLRQVPEAGPLLAQAFKDGWPAFFAQRSAAEIERDLFVPEPAGAGLPEVLVALLGGGEDGRSAGRIAGTVALRARSVETHGHLGPWITGLWVAPELRRRGLGRDLVLAVTAAAAARGFREIYAVTNTARHLFTGLRWERREELLYHGEEVSLFRRGDLVGLLDSGP